MNIAVKYDINSDDFRAAAAAIRGKNNAPVSIRWVGAQVLPAHIQTKTCQTSAKPDIMGVHHSAHDSPCKVRAGTTRRPSCHVGFASTNPFRSLPCLPRDPERTLSAQSATRCWCLQEPNSSNAPALKQPHHFRASGEPSTKTTPQSSMLFTVDAAERSAAMTPQQKSAMIERLATLLDELQLTSPCGTFHRSHTITSNRRSERNAQK